MKKNIFLPAFLFSLLTFGYAHAESIVMKNTVYGLEALSDEDIQTHGQVVSDILLKYCWPMCQDSDLTAEEQHELLSPEGNEERFLEKKLNETIPLSERDFEFAVIFVPTTLYELFCVSEIQKNTKLTSFLPKDICFLDVNKMNNVELMKNIELWPFPIIFAEPVSTKIKIDKLSNMIKEFNQQFYQLKAQNDSKKFSILTSYRLFIKELSNLPLFQVHDSIFLNHKTLSKFIKKNVSKLIEILAHDIFPYDDSFQYRIDTLGKNSLINSKEILRNYIECEYKAHEANQGLISRGSKQSPIHKIIASTLQNKGEKVDSDDKFNPYSISFSKSLLAGFINAFHGGCVLYYVTEKSCIGFCLYINKEQYFQNKINKLFFIQSFSSLTNLCATGEHFHPRCITAVKDSSQTTKIRSLESFIPTGTLDEAQILTVERDSLEHELTFLKYFIDNFQIFHLPGDNHLTPEEQQAEILHAQCEAFVETYALIKERQEQLARVLDAIAEVAAKEKDQKNENFGALLASTPETADLLAEDRAQQRIATLARHLAPATQDLTSAKL